MQLIPKLIREYVVKDDVRIVLNALAATERPNTTSPVRQYLKPAAATQRARPMAELEELEIFLPAHHPKADTYLKASHVS